MLSEDSGRVYACLPCPSLAVMSIWILPRISRPSCSTLSACMNAHCVAFLDPFINRKASLILHCTCSFFIRVTWVDALEQICPLTMSAFPSFPNLSYRPCGCICFLQCQVDSSQSWNYLSASCRRPLTKLFGTWIRITHVSDHGHLLSAYALYCSAVSRSRVQ